VRANLPNLKEHGLYIEDTLEYCHIPYICASHPKFWMSDPIRSNPQIRTGSVTISFFIHILFIYVMLNTAPFSISSLPVYWLCLLPAMFTDLFTCD
jgi:hypothetical protein